MAPEDYIGGGCGLITAVHAIDRAAIRLADRVLVQGTGAVGLCAIALARLPFREIGARVYPLSGLNEALADAEAMRLPKALVDRRGRRHQVQPLANLSV